MYVNSYAIAICKANSYFAANPNKPSMKKRILTFSLLGSLCIVALASCDKIKDKLFPAFDSEMAAVSVNIPITVQGVESSSSSTVSFNLDSTIKAYTVNSFGVDNLSSVKVKDIGIFLNNADDQNDVSNFETISLKFSSNTNTTPAVVASAVIPDAPAANLNIPATNSPELKEYLKGDKLTYFLSGRARRTTTKVLNATVLVTLSIK